MIFLISEFMKGKLIVVYGINNLGKTTQVERLVQKLTSIGRKAKFVKIPTYELEPSGVILDEYLRKGNPHHLAPREAQILYAFNRSQFEPILQSYLDQGLDIVLEDYWGTGVAWGIGREVDKEFLLRINSRCLREDLAFLLEGHRFDSGVEKNHINETDVQLLEIVARVHSELADEFGWKRINANQSVEKVGEDIFSEVKKIL